MHSGREVYFGTNEFLSFSSKEEYLKCFTEKDITEEQEKLLRDLLGWKSSDFGIVPISSENY